MTEKKIRGYALIGTLMHIDKAYGPQKDAIVASLSPDVRAAIDKYVQIEWYPIRHWSELLRGIALLQNDDEAKVIEAIGKAGESVAALATTTFLRLLLRVMTPSVFSSKLPSIWERDNNSGRFVRDSFDGNAGRWTLRLTEVESYDFVGPVARGWLSFAMTSMGKTNVKVAMKGWSLTRPGPAEIGYEVTWQA